MRTSFQSASSSSATIWASAVPIPWPISALVTWTVTAPSWVIVSHALGSKAAAATRGQPGIEKTRVSVAAPAPATNSRRLSGGNMSGSASDALDRALDAEICRTAAEVALHELDDLGI